MSVRTRGLTDHQIIELAENVSRTGQSLHYDHIKRLHTLAGVPMPKGMDSNSIKRWQVPIPSLKELIRKSKLRMSIS